MKEISCKLLVIGAGPGGYVCAIRAGQLGIDTVVVEANKMGGTCLNVGCIPSKAIIHAADEFEKTTRLAENNQLGIRANKPELDFGKTIIWKDLIVTRLNKGVAGLLKKAGVKTIIGRARFRDGKTVAVEIDGREQIIRADAIVIATGSTTSELPFLPFGGNIISSTEALSLTRIPKNLAVVGAGYIGLELGMAFAKLGASVCVVEAAEKILPLYDRELSDPVAKRMGELGIDIHTSAKAKRLSQDSGSLVVETKNSGQTKIKVDKILVTVGRTPVITDCGLDNLVIDMDGVFIGIDQFCQTSMRGIYAIGDVTGQPMLAHRAMAQGEMVAEIIAGKNRIWDKQAIPAVCFSDPEIVSVGLSLQDAQDKGIAVKCGKFPFTANGRAMTVQREDGFVRVVAREDNHVILGIQAVGTKVSELSAGFALALEMGARLEDLSATIHAHPTKSEAVQEAAMLALGSGLHI